MINIGPWRLHYHGNPWLVLLSVLCVILMLFLAYWQLLRGFDKQAQLQQLHHPPPSLNEGDLAALLDRPKQQLWFQPLQLTGNWLEHTLLLDNSIYKEIQPEQSTAYCFLVADCGPSTGRSLPGYRVFSLFAPRNSAWILLVERGWLAATDRDHLPSVPALTEHTTTIDGLVVPQAGARRVLQKDDINPVAPIQLVQSVKPSLLADALGKQVYPHPIFLSSLSKAALPQATSLANFSLIGPQRHWGYSAQWLLMALAIIMLCCYASFRMERRHG